MESPDTQNNIKGILRPHLAVFTILLALTLTTVAVSRLGVPNGTVTLIAYGIAAVQGALILVVLMHGGAEKRSIHALLALTAFFFAALLTLSAMSYYDVLEGITRDRAEPSTAQAPTVEEDPH